MRKVEFERDSNGHLERLAKLDRAASGLIEEERERLASIKIRGLSQGDARKKLVDETVSEAEKQQIRQELRSVEVNNSDIRKYLEKQSAGYRNLVSLRKLEIESFRPTESTNLLIERSRHFNKVIEFGSEKQPVLTAYINDGNLVGYTVQSKEGGPLLVEVEQPSCKINRFVKLDSVYFYLTHQLCHDLPQIRVIAQEVTDDDFNGFGVNCRAQGGIPTGPGNSGGCKCPNGPFIDAWSGTCLKARVKPPMTDRDRFESFVRARGGLLGANHDKLAYDKAERLCSQRALSLAASDPAGQRKNMPRARKGDVEK